MLLHVIVLCPHLSHRLHKPHVFSQNSFIYEIWRLFTFFPYSINITGSILKCVTLVKTNVCVKILLYASTRPRKTALVGNYFYWRINFHFNSSPLSLSLSHLAISDQINANVFFRRANYLYLATFRRLVVFLYPVST